MPHAPAAAHVAPASVPGNSLRHPIVSDELELLARTAESLAALPARSRAAEAPLEREMERLREVLLSGDEEKDAASLRQQWHRHAALLHQLRESGAAPRVDPRSPYFAHLRLRDARGERDLCLGRATCIDGGVRIVDWRNAPISRVFYRYQQGEDYEEEFGGRVHVGRVVARRTVGIRDGVLDRIEAPEGIFSLDPQAEDGWRRLERQAPRLSGGEASALRAHAVGASPSSLGVGAERALQRTDKRLPEISGLIDPAQFGLITRPQAGFLAIRGSAGSGKTTVALHRIAYLAFHDPVIDSDATLFVTFSVGLCNYVRHVLPALGVTRVPIRTYGDWATEQRRRHYPKLPAALRQDTPSWVQGIKLHAALGTALAEQVRRHPGAPAPEQALDDWASVLTNRGLLEETFAGEGPHAPGGDAIARFCEWSTRRNEELFAHLAGDPDEPAALDPEDETLLLRAWQLRVGPLRQRARRALRYRHIAIDEVQDFAPLEVQLLLGCLDERRSLTLSGDAQQQIGAHGGFRSWGELLGDLGVPGAEVETLQVSYRSTAEIMRFARSVLGDQAEDGALRVQRSGPPVEIFRFTDSGGCVAFLADALRALVDAEPLASVAVLTPSSALSEHYHRGLANCDLPALRRVERQDFTFAPGIEVTEIEQARGLEFDYVVLIEVSAEHFPDAPAARRLLHVGATRAVHQLWLTSVATASPLLAGASGA